MRKIKILLIDSDPPTRQLTKVLLERSLSLGSEVITSATTREAEEILKKENNIDAVVSGIMLKSQNNEAEDGFELLKRIKLISPKIPVIAFTAADEPGIKRKCLKAGFADYANKLNTSKLPGIIMKQVPCD